MCICYIVFPSMFCHTLHQPLLAVLGPVFLFLVIFRVVPSFWVPLPLGLFVVAFCFTFWVLVFASVFIFCFYGFPVADLDCALSNLVFWFPFYSGLPVYDPFLEIVFEFACHLFIKLHFHLTFGLLLEAWWRKCHGLGFHGFFWSGLSNLFSDWIQKNILSASLRRNAATSSCSNNDPKHTANSGRF